MTSLQDKANPPPRRPLIRYHGAKWMLAPWIISNLPNHRIYVEPFGGSAAILLRKARSYAEVYNDLDSELVNLFTVARDHGEELRRKLHLTPFAHDEFVRAYDSSSDPIEIARRTVVRAFMGHGSNSHAFKTGFRSNSNRSGTTPARDWMNYPEAFEAIICRLRGVIIENRDAIQIMETHDTSTTLHYVDPPYVADTRSGCKGYRHELSDEGHINLAKCLHNLRGMLVLSGYPCDLYDFALFSSWNRVERDALADGAKKRTEVLWLNTAAAEAIRNQGDMFQAPQQYLTAWNKSVVGMAYDPTPATRLRLR
jgi:DNA adenine methylase